LVLQFPAGVAGRRSLLIDHGLLHCIDISAHRKPTTVDILRDIVPYFDAVKRQHTKIIVHHVFK